MSEIPKARKRKTAFVLVSAALGFLAVLFSVAFAMDGDATGPLALFARPYDGWVMMWPAYAGLAALIVGTAIFIGLRSRPVLPAVAERDIAARDQDLRPLLPTGSLSAAMMQADTDGTVNRSAAQPTVYEHLNAPEGKLFVSLAPYTQTEGTRSVDRIAETGRGAQAGRDGSSHQPDAVTSQVQELAAAYAELKEAKDRSDQVAKLRSDFLATMSHEFRGPLNALLGFVDLASEGEPDHERAGFLAKASQAGRHLASIIDDVLDLTRAEAGRLELESVTFDLVDFAHATLEMIEPTLRNRKIELVLDVSPDLPQQITADPLRLRQIVMNFLTNAAKFTAEGEIVLALRRVDRDGQTFLRLSVEDSGIGLRAEQKERLFKSFSQADISIARLYGGSGLGLAICQQLATLMQGQVGVSSEAGKGSCFWFDLPAEGQVDWGAVSPRSSSGAGRVVWIGIANPRLRTILRSFLEYDGYSVEDLDVEVATSLSGAVAIYDGVEHLRVLGLEGQSVGQEREDLIKTPVHPRQLIARLSALSGVAQAQTSPDPQPAAPVRSHTVLVVDDDELNRDLAYTRLRRLGMSVRTVSTGAEALETVLKESFDLILMDHQMPEMDGVEATRRIRALALPLAKIPIVGVSGSDRPEVREACVQAGMNGFFLKPLNKEKLVEIVEKFLPDEGRSG